MLHNLYMDNILSGCDSLPAAIHYYNEARYILDAANFNLRSWTSNEPALKAIFYHDQTGEDCDTVNLLGLQ